MKILRGAWKIFRKPKGDSEKIRPGDSQNLFTSKPTGEGGGAPKKLHR